MPLPLLFLFFALCIGALALLTKTTALYRNARFSHTKKDCARALANLRRDITHYARRDPALLHAEILRHNAEDFHVCVRNLDAKKISKREARNTLQTIEKRALMLSRLYEQSAADRADYSDQSNAHALLSTVIPQALAHISELLQLLTEDQRDLLTKASEEFIRLKIGAASPCCDYRMLYAECALLHTQLTYIAILC